MAYQKGDKVEYRPIGGNSDNVSHSTGVIQNIVEVEDGNFVQTTRYTIKNDSTGKSTNYQASLRYPCNAFGPIAYSIHRRRTLSGRPKRIVPLDLSQFDGRV
ncbi:hypothetical protein CERSUDRAFT_125799 [Gelatoporia subvermispora B]|uniref:Hypervirulence associated protein TUDOR domain-containing protein n=1 Tax=Ceriporiopsis subvermispora (strain B) TaxID=914234 RepID=M2PE20_CERS8|nr:hypothetical protein CERSUDRAFT_125799 [Gelatoporia subvermispora B]